RDNAMACMIAATMRSRAAGKLAQNRDEGRIKTRNEENEDRHCEHRHKCARSSAGEIYQRRAGKKKSDEHRTAVAHKDRRRIRVVDQKTDQSRGETSEHQCFRRLICRDEIQSEKAG